MTIARTFGLIGYPLSHSFSKKYFTQKFKKENITDAVYQLFPLERVNDLSVLLKLHDKLCGLNVTIPYKEAVLPFLDQIDDAAAAIGAVNTIKITNGQLHGFNTDCYGFEKSLLPFLQKNTAYRALLLGTGGASKAVGYVLQKLGIPYQLVSRNARKDTLTYQQLTPAIIQKHLLIVNTTPLGMYPNVAYAPVLPYAAVGRKHILYDLVYNPEKTLFLEEGSRQGAQTKNGLEMLHLQAEKAWEIWNMP